MANFTYIAVNQMGKELKGALEAETKERVIDQLKKDGLIVVEINQAGVLNKEINISFLDKKPSPRDVAVFCRQFVSIINAGVAVVKALEMLGEQTENKRLRDALMGCKKDIEKGETLAKAMEKHSGIFPNIFTTMVEAGEVSGSLDVSFTRMAEQYEKDAALKATVKKATIYPIVVVCVAIVVVIGMLAFVIPAFEDMFVDLGTELPGITKVVIAASGFVQSQWILLLGILALGGIGISYFQRTEAGKHFFGKIVMALPLVNKLSTKTASARMARTMSTLLASGISMIEAIEITSNVMTNVYFKEALESVRDDVAVGATLAESIRQSKIFPPLVHHMISIGEDTGDLDAMLNNLASYYEDEVQQVTQQLMAVLEPMIIIVLAFVVGVIILAVLAPMSQMYNALDKM